ALPNDRRLVEALAATMREVYPSVHVFNVPWSMNNILVATAQQTTKENLDINRGLLPPDTAHMLTESLQVASDNYLPTEEDAVIFRDERAPVESIVDSTLLRYLLSAMGVG